MGAACFGRRVLEVEGQNKDLQDEEESLASVVSKNAATKKVDLFEIHLRTRITKVEEKKNGTLQLNCSMMPFLVS